MARFRARRNSQLRNLAPILITIAVVIGIATIGFPRRSPHALVAAQASRALSTPVQLLLSRTGLQWYGKPIYKLENAAPVALPRIAIYSWSNQLLPILYIGQSLPSSFASQPMLSNPPYDLPAHASLWFVEDRLPPVEITVEWTKGNRVLYQALGVHS